MKDTYNISDFKIKAVNKDVGPNENNSNLLTIWSWVEIINWAQFVELIE